MATHPSSEELRGVMKTFNLTYKLEQEFEVEVEAENEEEARSKVEDHDKNIKYEEQLCLAACERSGDLWIEDFDFVSCSEVPVKSS